MRTLTIKHAWEEDEIIPIPLRRNPDLYAQGIKYRKALEEILSESQKLLYAPEPYGSVAENMFNKIIQVLEKDAK